MVKETRMADLVDIDYPDEATSLSDEETVKTNAALDADRATSGIPAGSGR